MLSSIDYCRRWVTKPVLVAEQPDVSEIVKLQEAFKEGNPDVVNWYKAIEKELGLVNQTNP